MQGSAASVLTELWAMGLCGLGEQLVQGELGCLPEESLRGQHPDSPTASLPEAAARVAGRAEAPRCWPDCWDHLSTGWPHPLGAGGVGGGQGGRWAALVGTPPLHSPRKPTVPDSHAAPSVCFSQSESEEKVVTYDHIGPNVCMGDHKVTWPSCLSLSSFNATREGTRVEGGAGAACAPPCLPPHASSLGGGGCSG